MRNRRIIILSVICVGFSLSAFSQTTGKVVDTNNQPVEGATIVIQLPDSTYLEATISAADGTFMLKPEPESYQLIVQHLLYQTRQIKVGLMMSASLHWSRKTIIWRSSN